MTITGAPNIVQTSYPDFSLAGMVLPPTEIPRDIITRRCR